MPVDEGLVQPVLLEPLALDLVESGTPTLGEDRSEEMVLVLALGPIKRAVLGSARHPASKGLDDINALDTLVVLVVVDVEVDASHGDGLPGEPANALEAEDLVGVVTERLVLLWLMAM